MELATAAGYHVLGGETLWLARLFAITAWLVGGVLLVAIARRLGFGAGAVAALAVYLFLPFVIQYSRDFLPEPLMVSLMLAAILAMLRFDEAPSGRRLALVIALTAAAIFVKPMAIFVLYGVQGALAIRRLGLTGALRAPSSWAFALVPLIPVALYGLYGFFGAGFLAGQENGRFMPDLLATGQYWLGLVRVVTRVVTPLILVVAAIGLFVLPAGRPRWVAAGAAVGYAAFCVVFTYHASTHDYYHLQLVPLVSLAVGSLVARLSTRGRPWRFAIAAFVVTAVLAGSVLGVARFVSTPATRAEVGMAREIGDLVEHSARTVAIVPRPWPARWLPYYGEFATRTWLLPVEAAAAERAGKNPGWARDRARRILRNREFLVIVDRSQVDAIPGLLRALRRLGRPVADTPDYLILDLRDPPGRASGERRPSA